ncbi:MAG: hypothetical protein FAZ92_03367 [Accumulibacter sp.]|uniref:BREX-3 system P-loop-containing protein BrxF n=1 Tax=Accumulibacter sp. TaxID=2053492 RepID=UPI001204F33B|nr:BREX-3 system P-loop-containing protein BrxF [Accumulibacter sp.]TLD44379.1 MAG: hypothetical protein FAZ92_03367 [Accumulibacter sp.]
MLEQLDRLATDVVAINSKLILLVGAPAAGKTALLIAFGERVAVEPISVGPELGRRLAALPQRQRHLRVNGILRELADQHAVGDLVLLDNIELLFDRTLRLDPLDLLKRHAHARRVVAVWPGELRDGRLVYAEMGHPEHQDYGLEGLVPFAIQ